MRSLILTLGMICSFVLNIYGEKNEVNEDEGTINCKYLSSKAFEAFLKKHPNINKLTLNNANDEFLKILSAGVGKKLEKIDLSNSLVTDTGLEHLSKLTSLRELNLYMCYLTTDTGLEHLSKLTALQSLNLYMCCLITDAGLEHLSKLTSLRELNLSNCNRLTGKGLEHLLSKVPALNGR